MMLRSLMGCGRWSRRLDGYTGAWAICSLQKRITVYAGSAIRVRRSSDNVEADIGFDGRGALNIAALMAHVGSSSGYVTKFYDQSGSAHDVAHATAANQPRIVNAGVYDGKLVFNGTSNGLATAASSAATTAFTCFLIANLRSSAAQVVMLELSSNFNNYNGLMVLADPTAGTYLNTSQTTPSYYGVSSFSGVYPANNVQCYRTDRSQTSGANQNVIFVSGIKQTRSGSAGETSPLPSGNVVASPWYLGARGASSLFAPLDVFDLVIYESAKSDGDVAAISSILAP